MKQMTKKKMKRKKDKKIKKKEKEKKDKKITNHKILRPKGRVLDVQDKNSVGLLRLRERHI